MASTNSGGLLGADLVGFHTYDYTGHFLDSVHRLLGYEVAMGQVTAADRVVRADAFPMGINYEQFSSVAQTQKRKREKKVSQKTRRLPGNSFSGPSGLHQRHPPAIGSFQYVSGQKPEVQEESDSCFAGSPFTHKSGTLYTVEETARWTCGRNQRKYGTIGWMPVWYLYRSLPFHPLAALYSLADVALVTPLRDGMNLVAKEYTQPRRTGKGF